VDSTAATTSLAQFSAFGLSRGQRDAKRRAGCIARIGRIVTSVAFGKCLIVDDPSELEEIYRLRYRIYIEELKRHFPWADHERRLLSEPEDSGAVHFVVRRFGRPAIGCVRLHVGAAMPQKILNAMQVASFVQSDGYRGGYVSRLMLERSARGKGAAISMMLKMVEYGAASGCDYGLFHCNAKLVPYYERLGFRRCGAPFQWEHTETQTPMVFIRADKDYLMSVGSPFAVLLRHIRLPEHRVSQLRSAFLRQGVSAAPPRGTRPAPETSICASPNARI
jgi:predicted GNAT family N-acyltransferase